MLVICREVCKNEYIIPLTQELKDLYEDEAMRHSLRSVQTLSIQPKMTITEIEYVDTNMVAVRNSSSDNSAVSLCVFFQ